ncbi:CG0192-related protein [Saccharothrix sp. NRRL B-16314]|uniref:CG0192-related protein n=1 Tax=Saccharothrix sp. NRRL B-16314 TaxID=1463825 RepID=UPI00052631ED|nr:hypothetical protein [Saccharothrix sp. NRRL B-16314]
MALIHQATLQPTKLELLADWLPDRDWYDARAGEPTRVAAYRFDDPAGAVGIETLLVRVGDGPVLQVPLTYREAPLDGADEWLLGTSEHSVLGKRWVYDAAGDPVYAAALASAVLGNTGQAEQLVQTGDRLVRRDFDMSIASSAAQGAEAPAIGSIEGVVQGDPTLIVTATVELAVIRRLGADTAPTGTVLTGVWPGQDSPVALASATLR